MPLRLNVECSTIAKNITKLVISKSKFLKLLSYVGTYFTLFYVRQIFNLTKNLRFELVTVCQVTSLFLYPLYSLSI